MVAFIEVGQRGTTERITKSWCRGIIPMQPLVSHHADQGSGIPTRFCLAISRCMVLWWRGATSSATGQKKMVLKRKKKTSYGLNKWIPDSLQCRCSENVKEWKSEWKKCQVGVMLCEGVVTDRREDRREREERTKLFLRWEEEKVKKRKQVRLDAFTFLVY